MPEGPELFLAARFVNHSCTDRIFTGQVQKSAVSLKNPDIPWDEENYTISAVSRGKEVKLTLVSANDKTMDIMFRFGMSGKFKFQPVSGYKDEKHAHLNFFSKDDMVLSFVDYRRFGRWEATSIWGPNRGPCVIQEPQLFREHVLKHLDCSVFKKSICEVLLDQKYFNGIGNYLRAEVLYRLGIPPFAEARSVLEPLLETTSIKRENADLLDLCHQLPNEVIALSGGNGYIHSPEDEEGFSTFWQWLQCYYKEGMKNMVDHNGRTIWFDGPPGPLAPKEKKSRGKVPVERKKKRQQHSKKDLKTEKNEPFANEEEQVANNEPVANEEPDAKKSRNTRRQLKAEAEREAAAIPDANKKKRTKIKVEKVTEDCNSQEEKINRRRPRNKETSETIKTQSFRKTKPAKTNELHHQTASTVRRSSRKRT